MKKIQIDNFLDFEFNSNPLFSKCGSYITYIGQKIKKDENKYFAQLHIYDREMKTTEMISGLGHIASYQWTCENTILISQSDLSENEGTQFYEINPKTKNVEMSFQVPIKVQKLTFLSENLIIVLSTFDRNQNDDKSVDFDNTACDVFEEVPFWSNGVGKVSGKRKRLYVYSKNSGKVTPITGENFDVEDFYVQDKMILFKGSSYDGLKNKYPGIFLYDSITKTTKTILAQDTKRTGVVDFWGDQLLITMTNGEICGDNQFFDFYIYDLKHNTLELLQKYDATIGINAIGTDARLGNGQCCKSYEDKYYFITTNQQYSYLKYIDKKGKISVDITSPGSCDGFDVWNGEIVYCGMYGNSISEIFLNKQQLTFSNKDFYNNYQMQSPQFHNYKAKDGFDIQGWVLVPVGYCKGRSYPAIMNIHGGPHLAFGDIYYHEMQVWAAAGYFVIYCNPRGSVGYGNDFISISGEYGIVDYENLMEFKDFILEKYIDIDVNRVGVAGGSYGGYMVNWMIGHTECFKAAVSQRGISNWISFEHTSDIGSEYTRRELTVDTKENPEKLWWHSPIKYAAHIKTPTLFVHSDQDYRCWMGEGIAMFAALKKCGVDSRLCLFKGENHDLSRSGKPNSRVRRMQEILNWMDKYLK